MIKLPVSARVFIQKGLTIDEAHKARREYISNTKTVDETVAEVKENKQNNA